MRKAIYTRSRLWNYFWKNPTLENEPIYKNQRSKSVSPCKKYVKTLFNKATNNVIATNKVFWKFIKPFLTNKSCHEQNNMLIKDDKIVCEGKDLLEALNKHCVNFVENSGEIKPYNFALENNKSEGNAAIDLIIKFYENYLRIAKIKQKTEGTFI